MTYYKEKILFGGASAIGSAISTMGAINSAGLVRWGYVTLAVSFVGSAFLALLCRKATESIRVVIGRCGLTIMFSVFGSRALVHYYKLSVVEDDIILLGGVTMAICIIAYFAGHGLIRSLDSNSNNIGAMILNIILAIFKPKTEK